MKKLVTMLVAAAMLLSLAACGGSSGSGGANEKTSGSPDPASEPSASAAAEQREEQIVFDGLTVVDNEECSIRITEINPENMWGYTLKADLENKSADKTYMFSVKSAAVNGLQSDPLFASQVAAGKKSVESISFSDTDLEENGIDFTDIQLTFRVYDSDDWMADAVAEETVHIYPYGEDRATTFERASQSSDQVILDNEFVTATVIGYDADNLWGYTVNLYLENKTDKEVMFSVSEASVNGYMADPFWATSVIPGKSAFSSISWSDSTLEESGITNVEEIEFVLRAYDSDDWMADDFANETIVLNP